MKTCSILHLATLMPFLTASAPAEVTLDGTLGRAGALPGPNYQISADFGQQHGSNLFHSFRDFNLQSHESATFSGPDKVQNVISRVTGGNPSSIDGTLRSTIPNADLYFLNPYGIMFGPNARLDVQGGFHASTADYLRLQDGGRFEARYPNNSLLTVAPVATFGFLTETSSAISIQNSKLSVSEEQTLSLIGGELHFSGNPLVVIEEDKEPLFDANLTAPAGRINLVSMASRGEVGLTPTVITTPDAPSYGNMIINNTKIDTSGRGGGDIVIRGENINLNQSIVAGNTLGDQKGGIIDIRAHHLTLRSAEISTNSYATAAAGSIAIVTTGDFSASGIGIYGFGNIIRSTSGNWEDFAASGLTVNSNAGDAGSIKVVTAGQISFSDGAYLDTSTYGAGQGGSISVTADSLILSGMSHYNYPTGFYSVAEAGQTGDAGSIQIDVRQLNLLAGSTINTATAGKGNAGSIIINVADTLTLLGRTARPSSIRSTQSNPKAAGNAGTIIIQANNIHLIDGGEIATRAITTSGGNMVVNVNQLLYLQDGLIMASVKGGKGNGGNVTIESPQFVVLNPGQIIAQADAGSGGNIHIVAQQFLKTPDSLVSASSRVGLDGPVVIESPDQTIANSLLASPKWFGEVSDLFPRRCDRLSFEEFLNRSTFYVYPIAGSSLSPYDLKPSHAFRSWQKLPTVGLARVSKERRAIAGQRLAWLLGCHL